MDYEEHILSAYVEIGSPAVGFDSFWDVYNKLCDAVDTDFLERTTSGTFARPTRSHTSTEDDSVVDQLPLSELRPCVFGKNGVPALESTSQLSDDSDEGSGSGMARPLQFNQLEFLLTFYAEVDFRVTYTDDEGDELY